MADKRKSYPSDVTDEEWGFCVRYLRLMSEEAPQREYPMRELFDGLRWFVRAGCPWRMMPNDLPPWSAVYQQTQRWLKAGSFEAMAHDLRAILRLVQERHLCRAAGAFQLVSFNKWPDKSGTKPPQPTTGEMLRVMQAFELFARAVRERVTFVDNAIWLLCSRSGLNLNNLSLTSIARVTTSGHQ